MECIASAQRTHELVEELLGRWGGSGHTREADVLAVDGPAIGVDCEGVRLGRFGRICTVQLAEPGGRLFMLDALRPGLVEALAPLLESPAVAKVIHDCREDSAALYHQHKVQLRAVFDTQVAQGVLNARAGLRWHQASIQQLTREHLSLQDPPEVAQVKAMMLEDSRLWARRPLPGALARYAVLGVSRLLALRRALLQAATAAGGSALQEMAQVSEKAVSYCMLNKEFPSAAAMAKIGTRLWALVAARTDAGIFMKLNAGRVGLVNTLAAKGRFKDVQPGDTVLCCVSGVSIDGRYLYLDRYDHDWDFFDHQLRPTAQPEVGTYGRESRYRPSLIEPSETPDPLLLRGLPAAADAGAGLDDWDADYPDMGLPAELEDH